MSEHHFPFLSSLKRARTSRTLAAIGGGPAHRSSLPFCAWRILAGMAWFAVVGWLPERNWRCGLRVPIIH